MAVPILAPARELLRWLLRTDPEEYAKMFRSGPNQTIYIQQPLYLKTIDQPKLNPPIGKTSPYANYSPGKRANSRPAWYLTLTRPPSLSGALGWAGPVHFINRGLEPDFIDPITLERRGRILRVQQAKTPVYRAEGNRQRRDTKARRYKQLLAFVNRTYGTYSEVAEVAEAWQRSQNLSDFVEALAINEGIDRLYGARAAALKEYVYDKPFYKLPVGLNAIRSIWRLGT
jgi:hypothetical protein